MGLAEGTLSRTGTDVGIIAGCGTTGGGSAEKGRYRASFGVGSKAAGGERFVWGCASGVPFAVWGGEVSSRALGRSGSGVITVRYAGGRVGRGKRRRAVMVGCSGEAVWRMQTGHLWARGARLVGDGWEKRQRCRAEAWQ